MKKFQSGSNHYGLYFEFCIKKAEVSKNTLFNSFMSFKISLLVLSLFGSMLRAQDGSLVDFEEGLERVYSQDLVYELMDRSEKLDRVYFSDINAVQFQLEPDKNWRFLFKKTSGWEEIVGQKPDDLTAYFVSDLVNRMQGWEITQMFGTIGKPNEVNPVDIVQLSSKRFSETFLLRNKHHDYLVVIAVHAYPNGDMTSWFREERYYFEEE